MNDMWHGSARLEAPAHAEGITGATARRSGEGEREKEGRVKHLLSGGEKEKE